MVLQLVDNSCRISFSVSSNGCCNANWCRSLAMVSWQIDKSMRSEKSQPEQRPWDGSGPGYCSFLQRYQISESSPEYSASYAYAYAAKDRRSGHKLSSHRSYSSGCTIACEGAWQWICMLAEAGYWSLLITAARVSAWSRFSTSTRYSWAANFYQLFHDRKQKRHSCTPVGTEESLLGKVSLSTQATTHSSYRRGAESTDL